MLPGFKAQNERNKAKVEPLTVHFHSAWIFTTVVKSISRSSTNSYKPLSLLVITQSGHWAGHAWVSHQSRLQTKGYSVAVHDECIGMKITIASLELGGKGRIVYPRDLRYTLPLPSTNHTSETSVQSHKKGNTQQYNYTSCMPWQ